MATSKDGVKTYFVTIPAHKFLHIENRESNGYWDFWQKQALIPGQDCETICGLLESIRGKLDDDGGEYAGQVMGYLNDATGRLCDWGYLRTECYGARLPADYRGEVPAQMLLTDIPEGEYLVFEHGPFDYEQECRTVEEKVEAAMRGFDYAAERFITVVPEIEMPGHASAALASYPWLGCAGEGYKVQTLWGVFPEVFCAGRDTTFEFMEEVLDEVIALFPSEYIHVGGDECPKENWKRCPECQRRIREEGLRDENELQSYFIHRIERWLNAHGRRLIGWDEILEGGISQSATIMSWRGAAGGIAAARAGNHAIMTPNTHCYFDYYQTKDPRQEPWGIGGYVSVGKVYALDPYDQLTEAERPFILGVQANLWTEYVAGMAHLQHMLLPRLAALAEVGWACDRRDMESFRVRLGELRRLYERCGYRCAPYFFDRTDE